MAKKTIAAPKAESKASPRAKLSQHEIALIAEMLESGMSLQEIAARFE